MMRARCCGTASLRSATIAPDPTIDEAEPMPTSSLNGTSAYSPYGIATPVPRMPMAVSIVPPTINGLRPSESAIRPSGMLTSSRAAEGVARMIPSPAALSPESVA
ncbi:hypothetical protein T492DRAFT_1009531 [Pavlovales sp. CCMP2436]|nr:hypothetical protein T492DRAFT_1009531 [Pavlovales sp. CCMP2436]